MGRPEKPLNVKDSPIAAFASDLRELRRRAGEPSYRDMARHALFSPSVLSSAASGRRLPTLQVTLAFVDACGGDRAVWMERWRRLTGEPGPGQPPAAQRIPPPPEVPVLPRPVQLPFAPATFVGRRTQLAEARSIVTGSTAAPLVITGGIGVGKTALALKLAEELAADAPDGQLYADLGDVGLERVSSDTVLRGFLRALGVPEGQVPADPAQRAALYRSLLAERSVLVVLDDAREESQVRPLLAPTGASVTVVTSRARLLGLDGVRRLPVGLLNRTEAVSMLMGYVGARRIGAEPGAAAQIAEHCGDLPLALSVAGRRMAGQPDWPLCHAAQQFADRTRLLDRLSAGDLSVRGRIESAYRRLSSSARRAFGRLDPPVSPEFAPDLSDEVADSLVEHGLLQRATAAGYYRIPPMVELFAAEQRRRGDGRLIVLPGQTFRSTSARA